MSKKDALEALQNMSTEDVRNMLKGMTKEEIRALQKAGKLKVRHHTHVTLYPTHAYEIIPKYTHITSYTILANDAIHNKRI